MLFLDKCRCVNVAVLRACFTQARVTGHGVQRNSRTGFLGWEGKLESVAMNPAYINNSRGAIIALI
jgi:hypothetical protein